MIKLDAALSGITLLGLETAPIIYFMEANPQYDDLVTEIFQRIDTGVLDFSTRILDLFGSALASTGTNPTTIVVTPPPAVFVADPPVDR